MTPLSAWIYLIFAIFSNVCANVLIKKASLEPSENQLIVYLSPFFIFGLTLFGVNLLFYTQALRNLSMTLAYTILVGGSLLGVSIVSIFFLGESLGFGQIIGMLLVTLGIWLII
jgi:small multidrug resistance pump